MSVTLIIAEKPSASEKIATALADEKLKRMTRGKAYWFEFKRKNKNYICVPAVGHLFVLDTTKSGWNYPDFDVHWIPTFTRKGSEFTKRYYDNIKKLVGNADEFIIATDYDREGETIGLNILRFLCNRKDAKRMKFSTLVKSDLVEAHDNILPHLDFGQAEAGLTRHFLDFFYGINTTRALTLAMKQALTKTFAVVSTGRVQGPLLKILTDREIEIRKFKPVPFWQLELYLLVDGKKLVALYEKKQVWEKEQAKKIFDECKGKNAVVENVEKKKYNLLPPVPFDTTTLQTEAYACFRFSPSQTMSIAEALYNQGLISYPRTSSQKLPKKIGYRNILQDLSKISTLRKYCRELLSKKILKPREGKKCVTGDTYIILSNGEIQSIKNLIERNSPDSIITMNGKLGINPSKLVDKFSLNNKNEIVKITLWNNDEVSVTPDHPLFALTPEPSWIEAKDIEEGMFIAIPEKINVNRQSKASSILEIFDLFSEQEKRKILFSIDRNVNKLIQKKIPLRKLSKKICKDLNYKYNTVVSYFQRGKIPYLIIDYILEKKILSINDIKECVLGFTWAGAGGNKVIKLPFYLNSRFFYFAGLIAADGHNTGREIQITDTHELRRVFEELAKFFGLEMKKYTSNFSVASKLLCELLNKLYIFKGRKSCILDIHNLILRQPNEIVLAYIGGIFDGDGSVFRNNNTVTISLSSISKTFLRKIKTTLLTFGITSRFHKKDIRIYSEDCHEFLKTVGKYSKIKKKKLESLCNDTKSIISSKIIYLPSDILKRKLEENGLNLKKLKETSVGRIRLTSKKKYKGCYYLTKDRLKKLAIMIKDKMFLTLANSDIIWKEVKKISKEKYNFPVYDVTTETQSFIGNDIVLHNCDPAHPSIFPTGEFPKRLTSQQQRLYELITRRFFSLFGDPAIREVMKVTLDINNHKFILTGKRTIDPGWIRFYERFVRFEEQILPELKKGQVLSVKDLKLLDKETQPSRRYTQGSIIKEMDKRELGTRATRANILQTLYDRKYITGKSIQVTGFGEKVIEVLSEYSPKIISEELTRKFEEEMELIRENKKKKDTVVNEAKDVLTEVLSEFKKNEEKIGESLSKAYISFKKKENTIGKCPKCGGELKVIRSRRTGKRFIGCSNYPKCDRSYPMPQYGKITVLSKKCKECGLPVIRVSRRGRRPYKMCIDHKCKSKDGWNKKNDSK